MESEFVKEVIRLEPNMLTSLITAWENYATEVGVAGME